MKNLLHNEDEFDNMTTDELIEYFNKYNLFHHNQNSLAWNRAFVRVREVCGDPRPNPQTGLGI